MNATKKNAISSLASAISWLTSTFWWEYLDIEEEKEQVLINLQRAKDSIQTSLDMINEYETRLKAK